MKQSSGKQGLEYEKPQALRFDGRRAGAGQCRPGSGDAECIVGNSATACVPVGSGAGGCVQGTTPAEA